LGIIFSNLWIQIRNVNMVDHEDRNSYSGQKDRNSLQEPQKEFVPDSVHPLIQLKEQNSCKRNYILMNRQMRSMQGHQHRQMHMLSTFKAYLSRSVVYAKWALLLKDCLQLETESIIWIEQTKVSFHNNLIECTS
jgi:hypothetical protein